ncbi:16S rRNA (uracil(1498)-N(3))-methyltransferase [Antribacter gilvus]|uniref:16S rRNA (uracil(1498)-N(3))-methyltransferase n=1 Tax=Antribacter gilvus TaxID=2304675 RepID=UPI000F78891A|nr:16S rRNA (uracil(1498)-N(3))-methyltransferase [Antribacter gilvus]
MSAPVFLAETSSATPLSSYGEGSVYVLDGSEGRHAGVVQRRGPGERIDVVDGVGVRLETVVESVVGGSVHLRVLRVVVEPAPSVVLTLVQALAKGDRDEMAIEAATELGANVILPWQAERSVVVWRGDRAAKSRARWVSTVRAATKQARRACLPTVGDAVTTKQLAVRTAEVVAAGGVVVVLHEEATTPLAEVPLPQAAGDWGSRELLVVVGPEGGIAEAELAALTDAGAVAARLGPHVLRTSTAGPVAVAMLSERLGRWAV